ncbi:mobilization protein [uncultured Campylobacter sp.]|jgi:hypothetical protein|uniref:mobilization protein n=1 Tax=uncultured Campylobacter sp. TaxID=218934 RepID=UPI002623E8A7|nr:mobilization protein [uncultured Campylobacter sp.]
MSQISSINFKKSFAINAEHNDRTLPPSYLIDNEKGAECDRDAEQARELKEQIITRAKEAYTSRTGQRFQAKTYEWSAVCNIKPDTTMEDLKRLAQHFSDEYGFQCYQIAIHRDEGHIDEDGKKQINHHAHLEFITLDKTGINRQRELTPQKLRELQSEVSQILQMQRGEDKRKSGRQRTEPREYAKQKETEKKTTKQAINDLNKKIREIEKQQREALKEADNAFQTERKRMIEANNALVEMGLPKLYEKDQYTDLGKWRDLAKAKIQECNQAQILELKKQLEQEQRAHEATKKDYKDFKRERNEQILKITKEMMISTENFKTYDDYDYGILKAIDNLKRENDMLKTQNKALQEQNDIKDKEIIKLKQENATAVKFDDLKAYFSLINYRGSFENEKPNTISGDFSGKDREIDAKYSQLPLFDEFIKPNVLLAKKAHLEIMQEKEKERQKAVSQKIIKKDTGRSF